VGHHAQYRKRGSDRQGLPIATLPPQPDDWQTETVGLTLRAKLVGTPPGGASSLRSEWRTPGDQWNTGATIYPANTMMAIWAPDDAGDYEVRVAWAAGPGTFVQLSPFSAPKTLTTTA
jgi:hypothetical protein